MLFRDILKKGSDDMTILYRDDAVLVCVKPAGVLSTDEPGGMPELIRQLPEGLSADVRTVHRLDRVVGGLMVFARTPESASELSRQIREDIFEKKYLAVVHGDPGESGTLRDLMVRDRARKMSFVTDRPGKGVQEAVLEYDRLEQAREMSLVRIRLVTGRTHQIRCQFAAHGWDLAGERKYSLRDDPWGLALWSCFLSFSHPKTEEKMEFRLNPPASEPWSFFRYFEYSEN